ncbi:MAG: putative NRPS-like protein biosynthetic cluster [Pycnora praestabilis]|nr:MAG: putative NRPS-like protein biosynthetic cluster [Pycnora praestabilis]
MAVGEQSLPSRSKASASNYGKRLLPTLLDDTAHANPEKPFASIPRTSNPADGFKDVTYRQVANAINREAWWLQEQLGRSQKSETLTFVGLNDLRYLFIAFACAKVGYKALFISPRNSLQGNLALLESSQCTIVLTPIVVSLAVRAILARKSMRVLFVPEIEDLLEGAEVPEFPFHGKYNEASEETFITLHTSGSTGLPKIINVPHGSLTAGDASHRIPDSRGGHRIVTRQFKEGMRVFIALPPFHAGGIAILAGITIIQGSIAVFGPADTPMTPDLANSMHVHGSVEASCLPPSIVEDIAKTPSFLNNVGKLKFILFGSGPLPKAAGDKICERTRLYNLYGATETLFIPTEIMEPGDWEYLKFSPYAGVEFRHHSGDLYELFVVRDPRLTLFQGVFRTFPDLQEYSMKDLFSKHPTEPDLWLYRGRADDVIVFVNGEKLNPVSMEQTIQSHSEIRSTIVMGQGRFQSGLLIEPMKDSVISEEEKERMLQRIWPTVEQANQSCPTHGRLSKSFIMFTTPSKPIMRAAKGSIQRAQTLALYKDEIEALYTASDPTAGVHGAVALDTHDQESLASSLIYLFRHATGLKELKKDDEFFSHGLDSLMILQIVRQMKSSLVKNGDNPDALTTGTIYANPTVNKLASALFTLLHYNEDANGIDMTHYGIEQMEELLEEVSVDLPKPVGPAKRPHNEPLTVILTGSTGSLGSYILDALLANSKVGKIFCFNRSANSDERQKKSNAQRGLSTSWSKQRVEFYKNDLSKPYFGLDESLYAAMTSQVTHIVHNAWEVDFNLSLESFVATHVHGVRQFIDFAGLSSKRAQIFFTSSISTLMNWHANHTGKVPEAFDHDFGVPQPMGYAQSKYVSERLLENAGKVSKIPVSVCRVGQIGGPIMSDKGMWNKQEWLPTIIASSKYLGMLPDSLVSMGTVDWVPVDVLGKIIVELLQPPNDEEGSIARVYHTVNPHSTTWKALLPIVQKLLSRSTKAEMRVVSFTDWVDAVEASSSNLQDIDKNPALKLLDFYKGLEHTADRVLPTLATETTGKDSETLRGLGPVCEEWMGIWMKQWGF